MSNTGGGGFDRWVGSMLASGGYLSRRSVLGSAARGLLALAGVAVVGRRAAAAVGNGTNFSQCAALHGYTCEGKCEPNKGKNQNCFKSDLTQAGSGWVGCCQLGVGNEWSCLNLWDWVCEQRESAVDRATCAGRAPSGTVWWKGKFVSDPQYFTGAGEQYVCTEYEDLTPPNPGGPPNYGSEDDCASNCKKPVPNPGQGPKFQSPCSGDAWCKKTCKYTWDDTNSKWITTDTCAGDGATCVCTYPPNPGKKGDSVTTNCKPNIT